MQIRSEKDIEISCSDCKNKFWFSEKEQQFYKANGFTNPKRCKSCRTQRKQQRGGV